MTTRARTPGVTPGRLTSAELRAIADDFAALTVAPTLAMLDRARAADPPNAQRVALCESMLARRVEQCAGLIATAAFVAQQDRKPLSREEYHLRHAQT